MGEIQDDLDSIGKGSVSKINRNRYSKSYRIIKTSLLFVAWISFGLNNEMIGSTYEDLRVQLGLNYERMSTAFVLRLAGFLVMTPISGILYDKFSRYAELIMAISSFFFAFPNFLIPITRSYELALVWFLIQGIATASYDLGGNHIVFGVWKGISSSPVNAMHSGYGIGALIAVQIAKHHLKFDPLHKAKEREKQRLYGTNVTSSGNSTSQVTAKDIDLRIPYSIAASIGVLLAILFLIAQFIEMKNTKKFSQRYSAQLESLNREKENQETESDEPKVRNSLLKRLLFGEKRVESKNLVYMITQIILIIIMLVCLIGYITVISRFMLTYLTEGPAKLTVDTFTTVQTLYWIFFVVSRFASSFLGHIINPVLFVFIVLFANMILCLMFLLPFIAKTELFFWIGMSLMGITSGPLQPSTFMVAKTFLVDYNSFVLSIFSVGMGLGAILFQQISGSLLDAFTGSYETLLGFTNASESYIISYLFFIPSAFCLFFYVIISLIYLKRNPKKK